MARQTIIRFTSGNYSDITSGIYSGSSKLVEVLDDSEQLDFTGCNSNSFEAKVANISDRALIGEKIVVVQNENNVETRLFTGIIENAELQTDKTYRKIIAYDILHKKATVNITDWYNTYFNSHTNPKLKQFRDALFTYIGIEQVTTTLINDNITLKKSDAGTIKFIDAISDICEINGVFGNINRYGKFEYKSLDGQPAKTINIRSGGNVQDYTVFAIDKVQLNGDKAENVGTAGTGLNPFIVNGNILLFGKTSSQLSSIASTLFNKIKTITYIPIECQSVTADQTLLLGDKVTFTTHSNALFTSYIMRNELSGVQMLNQKLISKGNKTRKQTISDPTGDMKTLQNAMVNKLDAYEAIITYATITNLKALVGRVTSLESTQITTTYLQANYAKIDLANIANGAIKQAMIDNQAVGTAQIADASITDAKIVGLTANKILAGTLDAALINVINMNCANLTVGTINGNQITNGAIGQAKLDSTVQDSIATGTLDTQTGTQVESKKSQDAYALCEMQGASYQNGTPTPTTPISIQNSGTYNSTTQKYDVKLTARKKNLVGTDTSIYYPVDMSSGSRVVTLSTKTGIAPAGESKLVFYKADKSQDGYLLFNSTKASTGKITVTLPATVCYLKWETINATDLPMVERGSVATLYEDYKGNTQTVSFATPPRKNDKLILATEDKTIGANTVKKGDFYVEKHRAIMTLGSGDTFAVDGTNKYYCKNKVATGVKKSVSEIVVMSNYFKGISFNDINANDNSIYGNSSDERIRIVSTSFADATSLNTWLSTHTITIEYELDTPTYEILDSVSQANLHKLATYSGYTNISTDSTVKPTLTARFMSSLYSKLNDTGFVAQSKNKAYYQSTAPVGTDFSVNDVWFDSFNGNRMNKWDGTQWSQQLFGKDSIVAASITGDRIAANTITSNNILAGTITAESGIIESINANVITTGTLTGIMIRSTNYSLQESGMLIDLVSGELFSKNFMIYSDGTVMAKNGSFTGTINANLGYIGAWSINSSAIYKDISMGAGGGGETYRVYIQPPNTTDWSNSWVISSQYRNTSTSDNLFYARFYIKANGDAYFKGTLTASGTVNLGGSVYLNGDVNVSGLYSLTAPYINSLNHITTTKLLGRGSNLWLGYNYGCETYLIVKASSVTPSKTYGLDLGDSSFPFSTIFYKNLYQVSDLRKKTNVADISDESAKLFIQYLKPITFNYIDEDPSTSKTNWGFGAQDVESALLKMGLTPKDYNGLKIYTNGIDTNYGLDNTQLIPVLTKGNQILFNICDDHEQRIINLENQLAIANALIQSLTQNQVA